jgi:perosamine synthetase
LKDVGTQVHYIPVHTQPWYKKTYWYKIGDYPVAEGYYEKCLSLPLFPAMTDADVKTVIGAMKSIVK